MDIPSAFDQSRRQWVRLTLLSTASHWLAGCGSSGGSDAPAPSPTSGGPEPSPSPAPAPAPAPVTPAPAPVAATITAAYRPGQTYLFQSIGQKSYPSTLGGAGFDTDNWGPTYLYVDYFTGWTWQNPGGDWLDANQVAQGTAPWVSAPVGAVSGSSAVHTYTNVDVTSVVRFCQTNSRWLALLMRPTGAPRAIAGTFSALGPAPSISVTYNDGTTEFLSCRMVAASTDSSSMPRTVQDSTGLPAFVEFDRPSKSVSSAKLSVTVTEHWSGDSPKIDMYLCNPPLNLEPDTGGTGLASSAGLLDEGLAAASGVIGVQRYVDGSALGDFCAPSTVGGSVTSENAYDPALWGGTQDLSKFPHTVVGKWVNAPSGLSLVRSDYTGEGFQPLAPGVGALKLFMPDGGIRTGQEGGYTGTVASNSRLFMPYQDMGLLDHIFVRYYMRLGSPLVRVPADRREVLQSGLPKWSDLGGKTGIAPSHTTSYGGVSGSSGGGNGWQMRHAWSECEAAQGGPDEAGVMMGWHLYDFQSNNPPAYQYGGEFQNRNNWGRMGGHASVMYPGYWYCIETEVKLNSVNPANNTFTPDGALRTWLDGKLVYERTAMVFRTLPIFQPAYSSIDIRPFRQLGIKDLWWNWYNGGTTQSTVNRTMFVTGLVWARSRVGAMRK